MKIISWNKKLTLKILTDMGVNPKEWKKIIHTTKGTITLSRVDGDKKEVKTIKL